jgi:hypothetical protein
MQEKMMGKQGRHNIKKPKQTAGKKDQGKKPEDSKSTK